MNWSLILLWVVRVLLGWCALSFVTTVVLVWLQTRREELDWSPLAECECFDCVVWDEELQR